jgi:putative tricarboxylic transport membrane protein
MRREYLWTGASLLLGAGLTCVEALRLRYYTSLGPGPGFFPFWLSLALGACALALLAQAVRMPPPEAKSERLWPDRSGAYKILAVLACLIATIVLLEPLGYRLTMLAVYAFLLFTLGRRDYLVMALVSLAGSFGVYYLFVNWLQVPLPAGPFGP